MPQRPSIERAQLGVVGARSAAREGDISWTTTVVLRQSRLAKSTIDAPRAFREALAAAGVHDYAMQPIGERRTLAIQISDGRGVINGTITFVRPKTRGGSFSRFWIRGLRELAQPDDLLVLRIGQGRLTADLIKAGRAAAEPRAVYPQAVLPGGSLQATDFSRTQGGGERLVELLRQHVAIVMGGMPECAPEHWLGATASEISHAAEITLRGDRTICRAILDSLVEDGTVSTFKAGPTVKYRLTR